MRWGSPPEIWNTSRAADSGGWSRGSLRSSKETPTGSRLSSGLQERAERDEVTARQLIAVRFYIRHVVAGCVGNWISSASDQTNYAALLNSVDELRRDAGDDGPVVWVNFNYDKMMLDHAANQVLGWTLDRVDQYLANPNHAFFKPHGSTDWVRTVTFKASPAAGHQYEAIFRASEIDEFSDVIDVGAAQPGQVTVPALAVPIA
jgi:hypothetical protein